MSDTTDDADEDERTREFKAAFSLPRDPDPRPSTATIKGEYDPSCDPA